MIPLTARTTRSSSRSSSRRDNRSREDEKLLSSVPAHLQVGPLVSLLMDAGEPIVAELAKMGVSKQRLREAMEHMVRSELVDFARRKHTASKEERLADSREPFSHSGVLIYPTTVQSGGEQKPMWAVQSAGNKGTTKRIGDLLFRTREEAIDGVEEQLAQEREAERRKARAEQEAQAEAAAREEVELDTMRGFLVELKPRERALMRKTLGKPIRLSDGRVMSIRQRIEELHDSGSLELVATEESKIKPMSRMRSFRASNREQAEHERKMREGGKKTVYWVSGHELGKRAYDYANFLLESAEEPSVAGSTEVKGAPATIFVPGTTGVAEIAAQYLLVDAAEVLQSHHHMSFTRSDGYPPEYQERDYSRMADQREKVIIAAAQFRPELVYIPSPDATTGTPIVTRECEPDTGCRLLVLSGNGRTMIVKRVMDTDPARYGEELERMLSQFGGTYGIDRAAWPVDEPWFPERAMIVRVIADSEKRTPAQLSRLFNESLAYGKDAAEDAVSIGRVLPDELLESIGEQMLLSDDTFAAVLRSPALQAEIAHVLIREGIVPSGARAKWFETSRDGRPLPRLTAFARSSLESGLIGSLVGDSTLLDRQPGSVHRFLTSIAPFLVLVDKYADQADNPALRAWSITPALRKALAITALPDVGINPQEIRTLFETRGLFEGTMMDEGAVAKLREDPMAAAVLAWLIDAVKQPRVNGQKVRSYASSAVRALRDRAIGQEGLFGAQTVTPAEAQRNILSLDVGQVVEAGGAAEYLSRLGLPARRRNPEEGAKDREVQKFAPAELRSLVGENRAPAALSVTATFGADATRQLRASVARTGVAPAQSVDLSSVLRLPAWRGFFSVVFVGADYVWKIPAKYNGRGESINPKDALYGQGAGLLREYVLASVLAEIQCAGWRPFLRPMLAVDESQGVLALRYPRLHQLVGGIASSPDGETVLHEGTIHAAEADAVYCAFQRAEEATGMMQHDELQAGYDASGALRFYDFGFWFPVSEREAWATEHRASPMHADRGRQEVHSFLQRHHDASTPFPHTGAATKYWKEQIDDDKNPILRRVWADQEKEAREALRRYPSAYTEPEREYLTQVLGWT